MTAPTMLSILATLADGEERNIQAVLPPSVDMKFYRIAKRGEIDGRRMMWHNRPDVVDVLKIPTPALPELGIKPVALTSLAQPGFEFDGGQEHLGDVYNFGRSHLVSARVFKCIQDLDPTAIEFRSVDVRGLPGSATYFLIMVTRIIDLVDLQRTTVSIARRPVYDGSKYYAPRIDMGGYAIRDDLDPAIHIVSSPYRSELIWSRELWSRVAASGATGIYAQPTTESGIQNAIDI